MKLSNRQRLMASTLLFGAVGLSSPAWAQQQDPTQPDQGAPVSAVPNPTAAKADPGSSGQNDKEIVVTGSRIARKDLSSTSPLTVVKAEEFALTGSVNVEQVINSLPQVIPGSTAFSNNPGGGVATLNLRGLGPQRNLVLVNGRRYIFYDASQVTDLNTIPAFLLDSVDVVTGGASAVYGSDALAGVTNFHLRTDLKGLLVGGEYAITEKGDGPRRDIYSAIGGQFADGKGYATVYGEFYDRGSIFQGQRDFSRFSLGDGDGVLVPGGSANVPQGRFTAPAISTVNGTDFTIADGTVFNADNSGAIFRTPGVASAFQDPADRYNYAPVNYLMVPQKRWTIGGYGEYEVTPDIHAYGEVEFINNRVDNQLAATPVSQALNVPLAQTCAVVDAATCATLTSISNNELAANAAAAAAGRPLPFRSVRAGTGTVPVLTAGFVRLNGNYRFTQISNRVSLDDRNAYRMVGGVRGNLGLGDFKYDAYYSYARTKNSNIQVGNVSRSAFATNVANGTCNIFGADLLSQDCIDAVSIRAQNQDISTLQVTQGSISGNMFTLPWAKNGVGVAVGAEYRKTSAEFIPDTALSSGDVVGFNAGDSTKGGYNVKELFGELRVPIIEDGFISKLEVNGAARYSKYSLKAVGGVWTYAAGVEFAPVRDIAFRGQYQRAIRAPNVAELFGGTSVGFPAATDPCATAAAAADPTIKALCIATGVPSTSVGSTSLQPNSQIESAFGGNPNLKQEIGDTYTVGVVIRPRFIPRLNIAVDGYKIRVKNAISAAGGGTSGVLNLCYNIIQSASSPLCQAIIRDSSGIISGGDFVVNAGNANLAQFDTKGIDFQADYSTPLSFGLMGGRSKLSFYFLGNYTKKNSTTPVVGVDNVIECAGKFGNLCGQPTPKFKTTTRVSWLDGPLTSSLRWRHLNAVRDDDPGTDYVVERLPAYNLFDLAFSMNVTDHATFNVGINNLFNKKPPILGDQQEQANTFPSTYDVLGRDFFVSTQFRF